MADNVFERRHFSYIFRFEGDTEFAFQFDNEVEVGTRVVVETAKGLEYGWVVLGRREVDEERVQGGLKPIQRLASEQDDRRYETNREKSRRAYEICVEKIREHDCIDEKHPFKTGQFMSINDAHVNKYGDYIDSNTYKVPDENLKGIIRAANKDIMNWTAENRELFLAVEDYDPAKDKSSYTLSISVDYSLSEETVSKLEAYNRYYMFKTSDQNMANYIEKHPEIMSDKNAIADDDPTWGGNEM